MLKKAMLLLVCSLLIAALPAGYAYAETESGASATEQRLEAAAEGGALAGWQCYSCGEDGERRAAPGCLSVAEGYGGGQALKISSAEEGGELVCISRPFAAEERTEYSVSALVRLDDAGTVLTFGIEGEDACAQVRGGQDEWTRCAFTFTTWKGQKELSLILRTEGAGNFYVDDVQVAFSAGEDSPHKLMGIQNSPENDNPASYEALTGEDIAADSADGDGACLKLDDFDVYRTGFAILPKGGDYRLSFRYKKQASTDGVCQLFVRIDSELQDGTRAYYGPNVYGGSPDIWQAYTYDFRAGQGFDITWMSIWANGDYLIDDLRLISLDDGMQYIAEGDFSGARLEGYALSENVSYARQQDGSAAFVSAEYGVAENGRGGIAPDVSGLNAGEYTLSFEYRGGLGGNAGYVSCGGKTYLSLAASDEWESAECAFSYAGSPLYIYGSGGTGIATYFRNIRIEDAGGSVYTYNEGLCAENIFPCGTFEGDARPVLPGWTADENVFFTGEGIVFASDTAAKAVSIPVAVNGNAVQVAAEAEGEPEILLETENGTLLSPVNGVFFLPGGTQSVRVVLLACTGRVSSVTVRSHTCAFGSGENGVYTCSVCGAQISAAKDEPPASDGGGCASFAGTGACAVVAAAASAAAVLLMGRKKK